MQSAGKQEVVWRQCSLLHPFTNRVPSWLGDFELDWLGRFLLQDNCTGRYAITVTNVPYTQSHEVTCPELAVQAQVEQRKFSRSMAKLQADPDGPTVLELQGSLLVDDFSLFHGTLGGLMGTFSMMNSLKMKGAQL